MKLCNIATLLEVPCATDIEFTGICIDSRQVKPGNLFIAICGERLDGHAFIPKAIEQGAAAIICSRALIGLNFPHIVVPDTLQALARIATAHRQTLSPEVIALTGSNGKTTVKEMIAAILPKPSYATLGNLNNHIGVPLSLLNLKKEHRYAVFELGANHLGEIAYTVAMVDPKVTLINNIAPAHIEGFGSIEGVALAKGEIHQGLVEAGTAVINEDDAYAHFWDPLLKNKKVLRFSAVNPADVCARDIEFNAEGCGRFSLVTPQGEAKIELRVPGLHNVRNALAASACTHAIGISLSDIVTGLAQFSGVSGRMTFRQGKNDSLVIDDTYNANLRSSLTALDVLATRRGKRIFVFGDMGELGKWSQQHHQEVGLAARDHGIEVLMTCGSSSEAAAQAYGARGKHYHSQEDLLHDLMAQLDKNTTVLVKGSRSSAMEKIVHQLVG